MRLLCNFAVLVLAVATAPLHVRAASELDQHLRDQYKGKILVLRNFYAGGSLLYDTSGRLSGVASQGDWTVDGVIHVDDLRVSGDRLRIQARRLHLGWVGDAGFSDVQDYKGKDEKEDTRALRIEADLPASDVTADTADAVLARIFLTPQDYFVELVPDYWKPCVRAGLVGTASGQYASCRFSPEFLAIPGVPYLPELSPEAAKGPGTGSTNDVFRVGYGVAPPKVVYRRDPEYSPRRAGRNIRVPLLCSS